MRLTALVLATVTTTSAGVFTVGPDYVRPGFDAPAEYRDASGPGTWKISEPSETSPRGAWWSLFNDANLNQLEALVLAQNQDLRAAVSRVEQAAAAAGLSHSVYWPQLSGDSSVTRARTSGAAGNPLPNLVTIDYNAPLIASWEIDLFGRVRRLNESAKADASASEAVFESIRLSLTASLAAEYFSLRGTDREIAIVKKSVELRRRQLDLVAAQHRSGTATEFETSRAETELDSAEVDLKSLEARRESLQDALAVLAGESATTFAVPSATDASEVPTVPSGLPSALLERRPDVAAAERSLASANARIGVAKAAFFPAVSLTGSVGYEGARFENLFKVDSRTWSIGPNLYIPIFQGGRNKANLERTRAAYQESAALYKQQILVAFREVQEALTLMRLLSEEAGTQSRAVASAQRTALLAKSRFKAGYTSYFEVIDADRTALNHERAFAQLTAQRLDTAVALIKALGGGWSRDTAPWESSIRR